MKKSLLFLMLLCSSCAFAQTVSALKTFKNKEAKVKASNLYDIKVNKDNIEVIAAVKKGTAERLFLNNDLVLQRRVDTTFDFETEDQKKTREYMENFFAAPAAPISGSSEVIKTDVLEVTGTDLASKVVGTNLIQKGKVGMKLGGGFVLQKGDVIFWTNTVNYGADDMRGNTTNTGTSFVAKEEIKLKSEEGKNLTYEFHSSKAEDVEVEFKASRSSNRGLKEASSSKMQKLISEEADLLLIAKRKPIIKFGKAPSDEDLLPVYYIYNVSPKTMDVVQQNKITEPLARGIIFRETLRQNEGVLLVSAPTDITGDKSPNDTNPRNYVFRLVGHDTQLKFEFTHEVPAGWSFFNQALEMPDKSIVLIAAVNQKKKDKYINQIVYPINTDAFYFMTIKDGKVVQSELIQEEAFATSFVLPTGEKAGKNMYDPAKELTENIATEKLADGGLLAIWSVRETGANNIPAYTGDVALQFSADGKLVAKYWIGAKTPFIPGTATSLLKKNDHEFYLLTHTADEKGKVIGSFLTKLDTQTKSLGTRNTIGDEKHVLSTKFPYIQSSPEDIQFFGFDKGGKEFWSQKVILN